MFSSSDNTSSLAFGDAIMLTKFHCIRKCVCFNINGLDNVPFTPYVKMRLRYWCKHERRANKAAPTCGKKANNYRFSFLLIVVQYILERVKLRCAWYLQRLTLLVGIWIFLVFL